jgi:hypothetical protein
MTNMPIETKTAEDRPLSFVHRPSFFKAVLAIVQKDLAAEFRSRELLSAMLVFSMLVILIFNFAWNWTSSAEIRHSRCAVDDLRLCRHARTQPLDGSRKRPRLSGRSPARPGGPFCNLLWKSHQQPCLHADRGSDCPPAVRHCCTTRRASSSRVFSAWCCSVPSVISPSARCSRQCPYKPAHGISCSPSCCSLSRCRSCLLRSKQATGCSKARRFAEILTPLNLLIVYDVVFIAVAFMVFDFVVEE